MEKVMIGMISFRHIPQMELLGCATRSIYNDRVCSIPSIWTKFGQGVVVNYNILINQAHKTLYTINTYKHIIMAVLLYYITARHIYTVDPLTCMQPLQLAIRYIK